jgi:hypothetical protein
MGGRFPEPSSLATGRMHNQKGPSRPVEKNYLVDLAEKDSKVLLKSAGEGGGAQ